MGVDGQFRGHYKTASEPQGYPQPEPSRRQHGTTTAGCLQLKKGCTTFKIVVSMFAVVCIFCLSLSKQFLCFVLFGVVDSVLAGFCLCYCCGRLLCCCDEYRSPLVFVVLLILLNTDFQNHVPCVSNCDTNDAIACQQENYASLTRKIPDLTMTCLTRDASLS